MQHARVGRAVPCGVRSADDAAERPYVDDPPGDSETDHHSRFELRGEHCRGQVHPHDLVPLVIRDVEKGTRSAGATDGVDRNIELTEATLDQREEISHVEARSCVRPHEHRLGSQLAEFGHRGSTIDDVGHDDPASGSRQLRRAPPSDALAPARHERNGARQTQEVRGHTAMP